MGMSVSRRRVLACIAAGIGNATLGPLGCASRRSVAEALTSDPAQLELRQAANALQAGLLSPLELTQACLDRIVRLDPRLNSFITVTADQALADARRATDELARGLRRGPLHGIPIALKDNIDTAGVRTTAASAVFAERIPAADAEIVRRLKEAGAIVLGKLNLHEFALGTTSAVSHYGPVRNPWDTERSAGGSSGGCGAAVAASLCFGAIGTDTGGSIRIPAAACGIVGLKPTYGLVDTQGVIPVSTSFDHVGPMCRTVADTALMFSTMTDHPVAKAYQPDAPPPVAGFRVGVVRTTPPTCDVPVEHEVQATFDVAVELIRSLVAGIRDVELPMPDLGRVIDAEIYSFHASHLAATPDKYDPRTRSGLESGKRISAAEYTRLREELQRHRATAQRVFSEVDLVILPTLPASPLFIREAIDPFALPACTFPFSVGGWPAISIPCGFSSQGLPVGLLIGGPAFSEPRLFALAEAYERLTHWTGKRPPL